MGQPWFAMDGVGKKHVRRAVKFVQYTGYWLQGIHIETIVWQMDEDEVSTDQAIDLLWTTIAQAVKVKVLKLWICLSFIESQIVQVVELLLVMR